MKNDIINFILAVLAFILVNLFWQLPILMAWNYDNKLFLGLYVVYYVVLRILYKLAHKKS